MHSHSFGIPNGASGATLLAGLGGCSFVLLIATYTKAKQKVTACLPKMFTITCVCGGGGGACGVCVWGWWGCVWCVCGGGGCACGIGVCVWGWWGCVWCVCGGMVGVHVVCVCVEVVGVRVVCVCGGGGGACGMSV